MKDINIRIKNIVSDLDTLILLLLDIYLGELDEFLIFVFTLELCLLLFLCSIPPVICGIQTFKKTLLAYSLFIILILNLLLWRLRNNL
jgi:hypothetical protein